MKSYSKYSIPNKHNIDNEKLNLWLDNADKSIKSIATEFIMKTDYISYKKFVYILKKCIKEMLLFLKDTTVLQFYIVSDDVNYNFKSSYWIIKHIENYIDLSKYTIKIITNIKELNLSETIIIPDDASYSGSQIANTLENLNGLKCNIYIFIPFISNKAIDTIVESFRDNEIEGSLYFINKNKYIMKPIYEIMDANKIIKLFKYYVKDGLNIREYPIYFDHKVADSYSSFPLIYTYGVIPNKHNSEIILDCKKNLIPLKNKFANLQRIVFLNNCNNDFEFNIHRPACPIPPYKENFKKIDSKKIKSI
jgi:virulence-associated protein VapD